MGLSTPGVPPCTPTGSARLDTPKGTTRTEQTSDCVPLVAVMFATASADTAEVVIGKLTEECPARMVTEAGGWTRAELLLLKVMVTSAAAGAFSEMVPVTSWEP